MLNETLYVYGDDIGGVTLIDFMGDDARAAFAARVSFVDDLQGLHEGELSAKDARLLRFLLREKHTSPFEHSVITMKLTVPLFVRSQIMRHRVFSFNETSRRYTSENIDFFLPQDLRKQADKNLQCSIPEEPENMAKCISILRDATMSAYSAYETLLTEGVSREQARAILPQNLYTNFWITGSLHNYLHFLRLRLHPHAQPETAVVASAMRDVLASIFPETFKILDEMEVLP